MKKFYFLLIPFLFLSITTFAQVPVITSISGPTAVCSSPGAGTTFTAQATNSPLAYNWFVLPSNGVTIQNGNSSQATISFPHSTAVYTIACSASNSFGQGPIYTYTVMVYETPDVTFSGNTTFCQGSSTNIQASSTIYAASPTINYNWLPASGLDTYFGPNVMASPTIPTTYTVTATKGMCSNTGTITITPLAMPVINVNASNPVICQGQTTTLTASGAITYTWTNNVTNGVGFSPLFTAVYYVTGTGANGCEAWSYATVTVNPSPSISVGSSASTLCIGQSATLTINGSAQSYSLNGTSTPTVISITPSVTTAYQFTGVNSYGCSASLTFNQMVSACAGIEESDYNSNAYLVYPNPNNGSFNIVPTQDGLVSIYDQTGQLVKILEGQVQQTLTVEGLAPGIYFLNANRKNIKIVVLR